MTVRQTCPDCGTELPAEGTDGLCPKCLLGVAIEVENDTPTSPQAMT